MLDRNRPADVERQGHFGTLIEHEPERLVLQKRCDQFPVPPDALARHDTGRLQEIERTVGGDVELQIAMCRAHQRRLIGHPRAERLLKATDGGGLDHRGSAEHVSHVPTVLDLARRRGFIEEAGIDGGSDREDAVGMEVEPVDETPRLHRVDVGLYPIATVPRKDALEEGEELLVVVVTEEVVTAGFFTRVAFASGLAAFPVEVVVVVDDRATGHLGCEHDGQRRPHCRGWSSY